MYLNQNSFAHTGAIKELSFNEVEEVDGGWVAAVVVAVFIVAPFVAGVIDGAKEELDK